MEFLGAQGSVQVTQVVLMQDREAPRRGQVGGEEGVGSQLSALQYAHSWHGGHPGGKVVCRGRHDCDYG